MAEPFRAPLDLVARTLAITAVQGATIVGEISAKLERWIALKHPRQVVVPGIEDVSLLAGGSVWWCRGQVVSAAGVVPALGTLLASMLEPPRTPRAAPAGLLYVIARATEPRHLVPFSDLADFRNTLARYIGAAPRTTIDVLVARYAVACSGLPALGGESTISDVRRLRRAGRVPLAQIAADTAIPVSLLRELEWGIYTHWNLPHARGALHLYAERAGLDGDAIARVVQQEQALAVIADARPVQIAGRPTSSQRGAVRFALAAVVAAAVVIGGPGDRSSIGTATTGDRPAVVPRAAILVPESGVPSLSPGTLRVTERPEAVRTHQQVNPRGRRGPRLSTARVAEPVRTSRVSRPPSHPLRKLARAIAGDGRYRVEPFPRVGEEK